MKIAIDKQPKTAIRLKPIVCSLLVIFVVVLTWFKLPNPLIPIALGVLPLLVVAVMKQPFWVVLGFVCFSFFRLHEAFPALYVLRIPQLLALASLACLAWHLFISRKMQIYWGKELSCLMLFVALCAVGVVFASSRPVAMAYFNGVFSKIALMTVAIAWLMRRPEDFVKAAIAFCVCGLMIAIVALQNAAAGIEMVEGTRVTIGRSMGSVLGDPNDLALTLQFPLGFALAYSLKRGVSLVRLLALVSAVTIIMAILATQSRGGLLGIATISAVLAWRRVENKALLISAGALALPILFVLAGVSERSSGGAAESGIDESSMGRIYAWQAAFKMALYNPITGVGIDNFYANYYFFSSHWDGKNHAVHSTWFGVLAETGFVGFMVFCTLLFKVCRLAHQNLQALACEAKTKHAGLYSCAEGVFAGMLGTIVSGTFLTQGFTWPIYIFTALVVAIAQLLRQPLHNAKPTK
ncbi:O-antigen ligase [Agarivorans sp. Alg241-V36]|uniref:O-antigen ligase family protein n=1 Tax=Agarivorans sp. Alg241-V36 TaxID=2305992 RepID=UPI0013CF6E82|nr:O-antigen ligase family protein [Agarivorans sp. Alg241-V36]